MDVQEPLPVRDVEILPRAVLDGMGTGFTLEEHAAPYLASGALVHVLADWCQPLAGSFLNYQNQRQQPAALSALIQMLRV